MSDVYALYGEPGDPLVIPSGWQSAMPFATQLGPVNPQFFAFDPDVQYDSFVTIGMGGPALAQGALSSVGLDLVQWSETQGISAENGAIFFMNPDHGATVEPVVFLQLTIATGTRFSGSLSAQGRATQMGMQDWVKTGMQFNEQGGVALPPTPPAPPTLTDHCWIPPDFVSTPCQNGGACTSTADSYFCRCRQGFSGADCEILAGSPPPAPPSPPGPPRSRCQDDIDGYFSRAGLSCDSVWAAVDDSVGSGAVCSFDVGAVLNTKLAGGLPVGTIFEELCPVTCGTCVDTNCNAADLSSRSEAINRECCDEPGEDCSGGYPHSCNPGCAALLLPFWDDCQELLDGDARRLIEGTVAECEAIGTGTCGDLNNRIAGVNVVCCSPPRECTGAEPDICTSECAASFLGTLADCAAEMAGAFDIHAFDGFQTECADTMEACVGEPCLNGGVCSTAPPGYNTQVPFTYCADADRMHLYQWRPEAEEACIDDPTCWSLWDEGCNGGEGWWTCLSETGEDAHSEQCIYTAGGLEGGTGGRGVGENGGALAQGGGHRRAQWATTCDLTELVSECQAHPLPGQQPDLAELCANECMQELMPCALDPNYAGIVAGMMSPDPATGMQQVGQIGQIAPMCEQMATPPPPPAGPRPPPRPLCECPVNYYDYVCGSYCTDSVTCTGQGACNNDGQCDCYPGFSGRGCEIEANPTCVDLATGLPQDCGQGVCAIAVPADDVTWFSPMGGCDSYAPGQWNSEYCDEDTDITGFCAGGHCEDITAVGVSATEACPSACGAPARRMCVCRGGNDYYWNNGICVYCDPVVTCSGHGICDTWDDLGSCTCSPGFTGTNCETETDPCANFDCGQGVCTRKNPPGVIDLGSHDPSGFRRRRLQTMNPACEQDLHAQGAPFPEGTMIYNMCPLTCGTCDSSLPSCRDDPDGAIAAMPVYGGGTVSCADMVPSVDPGPSPKALGRPVPDDITWTNQHGSCRDYQLGKPGHGHCGGDNDGPGVNVSVAEHCPMSCGYQCVCDSGSCSGHGACDATGVCQCHDGWEGDACDVSWTEETASVDCGGDYTTVDDPWRNVAANQFGPNGAAMCDVPLFASCDEHESEGLIVAAEPTGVGGDTWWRFVGQGGDGLPLSYPGPNHCGTDFGGWVSGWSEENTVADLRPLATYNVSGRYPSVGDVVETSICMPNYNIPDHPLDIVPCFDHYTAGLVRCPPQVPSDPPGGFFLWRLPWAEHCYSAFCTVDTTPFGGPGQAGGGTGGTIPTKGR